MWSKSLCISRAASYLFLFFPWKYKKAASKVRYFSKKENFGTVLNVWQSRNDFFKPTCPPKMNEPILLYYYESSGRLVFVRFLEKIEDIKTTFWNNWPLAAQSAQKISYRSTYIQWICLWYCRNNCKVWHSTIIDRFGGFILYY